MHQLLDGIPLGEMNTSMTINATAAWLLALYVTVAEENASSAVPSRGRPRTTSSRSSWPAAPTRSPPGPSMRLIADMVAFTVNEIPKRNPINVCSYHLQEAGATPVQEVAYALSTAIAVLDEVKARGQVADDDFPKVFGRISFFVNAGVRFVEEHAKLRAMTRLWERSAASATASPTRSCLAHALRRPGELARPHRVPAREQRRRGSSSRRSR